MPDEEMDINMGQTDFAEDIDIDLGFTAGEADEDMELADVDQNQDMSNFNTDGRDEMMAEGDDESYGMVDADDADQSTIPPADDIDIDLGTNDDSWVQESAGNEADQVELDDAIDYVDHAPSNETGAVDGATESSIDTVEKSDWKSVEVPGPSDNAALEEHKEAGESTQHDLQSKDMSLINEASVDTNILSEDQALENPVAPPAEHEGLDLSLEETVQTTHAELVVDEQTENPENETSDDIGTTQHEHENENDASASLLQGDKAETASDTFSVHDEQGRDVPPTESYSNEEPEASKGLPNEDEVPETRPLEETNDGDEGAVATDAQNVVDETEAEADFSGAENADDSAQADWYSEEQASEDLTSAHGLYISYGQSDYRIFADSEDDDPNQYFLSDKSSLGLPLSGFLSSLREVIAEEVSPLDELVMHVDGLGLEFSESSNGDLLEKYTFGDILGLYDKLVRNDETKPDHGLYTYLMVRPSCSQRLVALLDSARSGHGLSEIAVYRETTPFDGGDGGEASPLAGSSNSDDEGVNSTSFAGDGEAENDGVQDEHHAETDEQHGSYEGTDEASEEGDGEVRGVHFGMENHKEEGGSSNLETSGDATELHEAEYENLDEYEEGEDNAAEDLLDYSDEEIDLTVQDPPQDQSVEDEAFESAEHRDDAETSAIAQPGSVTETKADSSDHPGTTSEHTSVTATLNGDDKDEIDYSDNDEGEPEPQAEDSKQSEDQSDLLQVPVDDEITWESEDELAGPGTEETVQVSPSTGKRARSQSGGPEGASEENDAKRRRS